MSAALRLGTRRSALARAQSGQVAEAIGASLGRPVELVDVVTEGDRSSAALTVIGGTGVFVSALRDALRAGVVDVAVHSLKDLPTQPDAGVVLAAVPQREDPRDALCAPGGLTLGELVPGSRIGTGSPRRAAQLDALGFGLSVVPVRGNIDTRLALIDKGEVDAVVLARAGLVRLGRTHVISETLDPLLMLPAPGQGALAVECRADDVALATQLRAAVGDPVTTQTTAAERALLAALGAGCSAPVGALADYVEGLDEPDEIYLRAVVADTDGELVRRSVSGPAARGADLGRELAAILLEDLPSWSHLQPVLP